MVRFRGKESTQPSRQLLSLAPREGVKLVLPLSRHGTLVCLGKSPSACWTAPGADPGLACGRAPLYPVPNPSSTSREALAPGKAERDDPASYDREQDRAGTRTWRRGTATAKWEAGPSLRPGARRRSPLPPRGSYPRESLPGQRHPGSRWSPREPRPPATPSVGYVVQLHGRGLPIHHSGRRFGEGSTDPRRPTVLERPPRHAGSHQLWRMGSSAVPRGKKRPRIRLAAVDRTVRTLSNGLCFSGGASRR